MDTLINGSRPSFLRLQVSLNGVDQARGVFMSLDYGVTQKPGEIYSKSQSQIVGSTPGKSSATGEFEMLVTELNSFFAQLTGSNQVAITNVIFDIHISYSTSDIDVQTDQLLGCRITDVRAPNSGTKATSKVCSFLYKQLVTNGIVVGGDVAIGGPSMPPAGATLVASDFWYGPVYQDQTGLWFCPGFVGNTYFADPWSSVQVAVPFLGAELPQTPGICEVKMRKYRDVDKTKKAAGTDGKRVTIHGIEPAEGDIEVLIWTPQQFRMLMGLWPVLFPGPQKFTTTKTVPTPGVQNSTTTVTGATTGTVGASGTRVATTQTIPLASQTKRVSTTQTKSIIRPFDVAHPTFKLHNVNSIVFVDGEGPTEGPVPFSRVFTMKWVEFLLPGTVNATTSPQAAKSSTLDPAGYQTPGSNPANSNLVG